MMVSNRDESKERDQQHHLGQLPSSPAVGAMGATTAQPSKDIPLCSMQELDDKRCVFKWVDELRDEIAAILIDGKVILRSSICPHFGGEFAFLPAEEMLECKWHGWKFDVRTGECRNYRIGTTLRLYPFEIVDGTIFVKCG